MASLFSGLLLFLRDISGGNPPHLLNFGDFNINGIGWNNINSTENETHTSTLFLECLRDKLLYQRVKEPTRYRSQNVPLILDLILTKEESMVSNLQYKSGLRKSDHLVLEFTYNYYIRSSDHPSKKFICFKGDYRKISEILEENNWKQDLQGTSLSEEWEILTEELIQLLEENVNVSKVSSAADHKNLYVSNQYMVAIKKKNHTKWQKYLHIKSEQKYIQYKIAKNTQLRRCKYNYEKYLAAKIKTDNELFWSYVRSKMKTKSFELPDGSYTNDNQEKAEISNSYFASVLQWRDQ